ncbi:MAG: hypothetical protein JXR40_06895 [Pontiellaceae bacterium]|nr:hypothetical protein [Pontiellaceae bacterium]
MKTTLFKSHVQEIVRGAIRNGAISPASHPYHLAQLTTPERLRCFEATYFRKETA